MPAGGLRVQAQRRATQAPGLVGISLSYVRLPTLLLLLAALLVPVWTPLAGQDLDNPPAPSTENQADEDPGSLFGQTITRIGFTPAVQPFSTDEILRLLPFEVGDTLEAGHAGEVINRLFATGRYGDIAVEATPETGGVAINIATELAFFVSQVIIEGEKEPPNANQLISASGLDLGELFRAEFIPGAIAGMQERLEANGFYGTRIRSRFQTDPATEEVNILFRVEADDRASFSGVDFTGEFPESISSLERATGWHRRIGWVPLPGWRDLTEARLQEGIQNLREELQEDDRLEATVELEDLTYNEQENTVLPHVEIQSGPVTRVRVTGFDIGGGTLQEELPIYQERSVDRGLLVEGQRNLTEYMQSKGYFDAVVSFTQTTEGDESVIEYQIQPGNRYKLESISFTGNEYFDDVTLRERMFIQPATLIRFRNGRYSPQLLEQDLGSIRNLYRSNGFREVEVTSISERNANDPSRLDLRINIEEGPQWFVNSLTIEGISDDEVAYFEGVLRSTTGQPFSEVNVAADRETVLTYYYNRGFSDAGFEWVQEPLTAEPFVDLQFRVDPGERQFVRNVLIRGLDATDPELVSSRVTLMPGDPISQSEIAQSQQNLYDLGIFANVEAAIQNPEGEEESKYVILYMNEASKYSFNFGVGAELGRIGGGTTTFSNPGGATGFAPRVSLGISRINFLGVGHTVSLQTLASTRQQRALLNYVAPHFRENDDLSLTFSALFDDSRNVRTFTSRRWEGSVQLSQKLNLANTLQFRFAYRRVTIDENSLAISADLIPLFSQPVRVGMLAVSFFQDRRDDPVETRRGIYNTIDIGYASRAFGSETGFTRLLLRNSTYHPIGREIVLARTIQFGYMQRLTGLPEIPLAERFFAGGAASHRGFPDNQAGPRDLDTGFPLGGEAVLYHSTELRFPLIGDSIGGVFFHDMGNVFDSIREISFRVSQRDLEDFNYMVHSGGFGIRVRTPVGPLRVDLSYSPNSPRFFGFSGTREELLAGEGEKIEQRINPIQFHFSLGQTF